MIVLPAVIDGAAVDRVVRTADLWHALAQSVGGVSDELAGCRRHLRGGAWAAPGAAGFEARLGRLVLGGDALAHAATRVGRALGEFADTLEAVRRHGRDTLWASPGVPRPADPLVERAGHAHLKAAVATLAAVLSAVGAALEQDGHERGVGEAVRDRTDAPESRNGAVAVSVHGPPSPRGRLRIGPVPQPPDGEPPAVAPIVPGLPDLAVPGLAVPGFPVPGLAVPGLLVPDPGAGGPSEPRWRGVGAGAAGSVPDTPRSDTPLSDTPPSERFGDLHGGLDRLAALYPEARAAIEAAREQLTGRRSPTASVLPDQDRSRL